MPRVACILLAALTPDGTDWDSVHSDRPTELSPCDTGYVTEDEKAARVGSCEPQWVSGLLVNVLWWGIGPALGTSHHFSSQLSWGLGWKCSPKAREGERNCNDTQEFGPRCLFMERGLVLLLDTSFSWVIAGVRRCLGLSPQYRCGRSNPPAPRFCCKSTCGLWINTGVLITLPSCRNLGGKASWKQGTLMAQMG